jgi:hypothetical protein
MLAFFVLGIALLIGLILATRWFVQAEPREVVRALRWIGATLAIGVVILLVVTRQIGWIIALLPALLPWFFRMRSAARTAKNWQRAAGGGAAGQTSEVETAYLRMRLDHDSGEMDGEVLQGRFAGRRVGEMGLGELLNLLAECQEDAESARVLETYLDRVHGEEWREQAAGDGERAAAGAMTEEEAYAILGLEPGADSREVKAAYHRLMSKLHPDHGGSTYLASKLNQAKDLLLRG